MAMDPNTPPGVKRPKAGRSPAYPGIALDKAVTQARALYEREGKYAVPQTSAFKAWGYGDKSSGGRTTVAALKYFGLIDIVGEGDSRQIKLSQDGLLLLLDQREDDSERRAVARKLALRPSIHQQLYHRYPDGLPSDATIKHFLMFDGRYNESAAAEIVAEFKETAVYAGLYQPHSDIDNNEVDGDGGEEMQQAEIQRDPPSSPASKVSTASRPQAEYRVMEGERVVFTEEGQPRQYLKLIASGELDDGLLEALEDFVRRQRKRLRTSVASDPQPN